MSRLGGWCGVIACLVAIAPMIVSEQKKKYTDPTPRKEAILKRFVQEFVRITPGQGKFPKSFLMGSKAGNPREQPAHTVTFGYPFAVGRYEVTQELYHVVMGRNPAKWKGRRNSVEEVTWDDAQAFCRKVTVLLRARKLIGDDDQIRLPSEAEWEYACRAGTQTAYSFGDDVKQLTLYCWYKDNSKGYDPPVGAKKPNPWGLYDMHGYVWEWCADDWFPGYRGAPNDGRPRKASNKGAKKVVRGGSWAHPADQCRSAYRDYRPRNHHDDKVGFRCVLASPRDRR